MPTSTRRQAARSAEQSSTPATEHDPPSYLAATEDVEDDEEEEVEDAMDEEIEGPGTVVSSRQIARSTLTKLMTEEDEDLLELTPEAFPPPGLKEISSLASWTVSTAKPGNGVAALRSPDPNLFWQSDGPQPHLLSIHFFKVVSIVHMRIHLDFENDESYTPTKMQFLAGMGVHDLQEFAEMSFEQPTGWIDVDFSNVGPIDDDESQEGNGRNQIDWSKRPVLRAFLVQVRILENHQNGKDTHLRAVQLFARDDEQQKPQSPRKLTSTIPVRGLNKAVLPRKEQNNIKLASWMMEPDLR